MHVGYPGKKCGDPPRYSNTLGYNVNKRTRKSGPEGEVVHRLVVEEVRFLDDRSCLCGTVLQFVLERYDVPEVS